MLLSGTLRNARNLSAVALFAILLSGIPALSPAAPEEDAEKPQQPVYHKLKPSLIANLASGGKFVRCDVQFMTLHEEVLPDLQLHAPVLRHQLLLLLSDQDGKQLRTPTGKNELRTQALEISRKTMTEEVGKPEIEDLFFTSFLVQ